MTSDNEQQENIKKCLESFKKCFLAIEQAFQCYVEEVEGIEDGESIYYAVIRLLAATVDSQMQRFFTNAGTDEFKFFLSKMISSYSQMNTIKSSPEIIQEIIEKMQNTLNENSKEKEK